MVGHKLLLFAFGTASAIILASAGEAALQSGWALLPGNSPSPDTGLPNPGGLTLAGTAGDTLVGLTLRPGQPGSNQVLLYLLPQDNQLASGITAKVKTATAIIDLQRCGTGCRKGTLDLRGEEAVTVSLSGSRSGTVQFRLPSLPSPAGDAVLARIQQRMHQLRGYRIEEDLGPAAPPVHTSYTFDAPDRLQFQVSNGYQFIRIGAAAYRRDSPDAPWQVEQLGDSLQVPRFIWEPLGGAQPVSPRLLDDDSVSFFLQDGATPEWFRLWPDAEGLVARAEMRAQGHFMDHQYSAFDAPPAITPPTDRVP